MTEEAARQPVIVTGGSGGIGADIARIFARKGHPVALVARNAERMQALAQELEASGAPRLVTVALDLAGEGAAKNLLERLRAEDFRPAILVNNAGFGLSGAVDSLPREKQLALLDLNIRALTDLTLTFLPDIVETRGKILNVASLAAMFPGPGMAVYYASKAYVLSFSEALSEELKRQGVSVTALCPGPVDTEFFERAGARGGKAPGGSKMLPVKVVAEAGYRGLMKGRRVVVPGVRDRLIAMVSPFLPHALTLPLIARLQMKRRK